MRRLLVMAIGLGTIACGSDKPTEPPATMAGTWDGAAPGQPFTLVLADSSVAPYVTGTATFVNTHGDAETGKALRASYQGERFIGTFVSASDGARIAIDCTLTTRAQCDGTYAFGSLTAVSMSMARR